MLIMLTLEASQRAGDEGPNWEMEIRCHMLWHLGPIDGEAQSTRWLEFSIMLHVSVVSPCQLLVSQICSNAFL